MLDRGLPRIRSAHGVCFRELSAQPIDATTVSFADASQPGTGRGSRLTHWQWDFGDPATGALDQATGRHPSHAFSAPGQYTVTLTVTDHNGLRATRQVVVTS